jgi:hypothetical protein
MRGDPAVPSLLLLPGLRRRRFRIRGVLATILLQKAFPTSVLAVTITTAQRHGFLTSCDRCATDECEQ